MKIRRGWLDTPESRRFWSKVQRRGLCWEWTGWRNAGYGMFSLALGSGGDRRLVRAHRWAYEHLVGSIPDGLTIDHLCRNRACVRPGHLQPVTQALNCLRGQSIPSRNARKTHCKRGHPLSGSNLRLLDAGKQRRCRACDRLRKNGPVAMAGGIPVATNDALPDGF